MTEHDDPRRNADSAPARTGALANVVLVALSTIVSLALAEAVLTVYGYEHSPLTIVAGPGNDARQYHLFEDDNFTYDPDLIWRPKKSFSVFNAQGFRGPELPATKAPGSFRVFTVGDSNTLGWQGVDGPNWPAYLGERLQKVVPGAVVVNAGVWGYSSYQGLVRLREVLALEPDLVLISFGANDAHPVTVSDREFAATPERRIGLARALQGFRLGQLLLALFDARASGGGDVIKPRVGLDEYRQNLTEMVEACARNGVKVLLMTRPYVGPLPATPEWKTAAPAYNAATIEVASMQGVGAIDLYSSFRDTEKYFADESHFTEEGHRLAAKIVLDELRPYLPR